MTQGTAIRAWLPVRAFDDADLIGRRVRIWDGDQHIYGKVTGIEGHGLDVAWDDGETSTADLRYCRSLFAEDVKS